ncbi:SCO family protein [uncultured Croceitalea sp.]|uniref:SCO family protein n=1 Tax=uncultured Croceitalea sp. TaxID=1798908 RepID=UPI003305D79A
MKKISLTFLLLYVCILVLANSVIKNDNDQKESLPFLGEFSIDKTTGDTLYFKAPKFNLINQAGQRVTDKRFQGKIQVIDFFFTSCPTICPVMTNHLKMVQDHFWEVDELAIISYSIDATNDTPKELRSYADFHGLDTEKWSLLTGDSERIFEHAKGHKVRAFDDSIADGLNLIHDGTFVLLDENRHVRGYYDGLSKKDTQRLIKDINILLKAL